jgi:hypothetical protein
MEGQFDLHYLRSQRPERREPTEVFTAIASELGLIRPGDKLDRAMIEFAMAVVEKCAAVADCYFDNRKDTCVGDHIRAVYGYRTPPST